MSDLLQIGLQILKAKLLMKFKTQLRATLLIKLIVNNRYKLKPISLQKIKHKIKRILKMALLKIRDLT